MPSENKNKIKTFLIDIQKNAGAKPSRFLIDLKKNFTRQPEKQKPAENKFFSFTKPEPKKHLKKISGLFSFAQKSLKEFLKNLPSPRFPKLINPAPSNGVLNPAGRFSLTIHPRSRAAGYSGRCWINKKAVLLKVKKSLAILSIKNKRTKKPLLKKISFKKFQRHWQSFFSQEWHELTSHLAAFLIFLLIVILPLQAVLAYQRAQGAQKQIKSNVSLLQGSLSWAKLAAEKNDLAQVQKAIQSASAALEKTNLALSKTWPLTLYPPMRSLEHLLVIGQKTSDNVSELINLFSQNKNNNLDFAKTIFQSQKYLSQLLALSADGEQSLRKINAWPLPSSLKKYTQTGENLLKQWNKNSNYFSEILFALPDLLGQKQNKKYLVIFQNNHEIRPTGGFMGSFAYLEMENGLVKKWEVPGGGPYDLQSSFKEKISAPAPLRLVNARFEFQDLNWFPDFPTSAQKIFQVYEKAAGQTVDGVIAITADLAADLLKITGPLTMANNKTINDQNFFTETQKAVEIDYDRQINQPKKFIADLFQKMFEKLTQDGTNNLVPIIKTAFNGLANKDIQIYLTDQNQEEKIKQLGFGGEIKETNGDYLMVVSANIGGGKTDGAIEQKIEKQTVVEADGRLVSQLKITRTHQGVKGDLWTGQRNVVFLRAYVPKGSQLLDSQGFETPPSYLFKKSDEFFKPDVNVRQGEEAGQITADNTFIYEENNKTVFGNWLQLDPGQTQEATFVYELPFRLNFAKKPAAYTLTIQKQAGRRQDIIQASFQSTAGEILKIGNGTADSNSAASEKFFAFLVK